MVFDVIHLFQNMIQEQSKTFDESHERHFIDMYINKMRQEESNPDQTSHYSCKFQSYIYHLDY